MSALTRPHPPLSPRGSRQILTLLLPFGHLSPAASMPRIQISFTGDADASQAFRTPLGSLPLQGIAQTIQVCCSHSIPAHVEQQKLVISSCIALSICH